MTQEQKYDEALKRAKKLYEQGTITESLSYVFPELKESEGEDEKIRKEIIKFIKKRDRSGCDYDYDQWLDWLEKQGEHANFLSKIQVGDKVTRNEGGVLVNISQLNRVAKKRKKQGEQNLIMAKSPQLGEQKSANNNEPKFHKGEWIVFNGLTLYVKEVVKGFYRTISKGGITNSYDWDIDNVARLWTIQDAKKGDVLYCESGWTCIFKTLVNDETFSSYCFMDKTKWFCETGSECHTLKEEFIKAYNGKIHPATKEQRDTLFAKMKEAGYEWDAEKKKLEKIEYETEIPFGAKDSELQEVTYFIPKGFHAEIDDDKVVIKKGEKPTAWSEEDEKTLQGIIDEIAANKSDAPEYDIETYDRFLTWLKSLRPQPKQGWSEEDENEVAILEAYIRSKEWSERHIDRALGIVDELVNKAKSLKSQKHWKPSGEQIMCLQDALSDYHRRGYKAETLETLLEQLKQL